MATDKLYFDTSEANNLDKNISPPNPGLATPSNVKKDYLFKDVDTKEVLSGTMPIIPAENIKLSPEINNNSVSSYNIPLGYHDGNGKVYVGKLEEYTYGNAKPEHIANNRVAWVNGKRIVGTLDLDENDQEATATSSDLLEGKTAWVKRNKITGTIPKLPKRDKNLLAGERYVFPYGLSLGTSTIIAVPLDEQTPGTATKDKILKGHIAWVNGQKIEGTFDFEEEIKDLFSGTNANPENVLEGSIFYSNTSGMAEGTMKDHSGEPSRELRPGQTFNIPEGYYDGLSSITVQSLHDATIADATPENIINRKTAWVNGEKISGSMPVNSPKHETLDAGNTYTIPKGYHSGTGKITAVGLPIQTPGTATKQDIRNGETAWVNGILLTGSMNENTPSTKKIEPGETYIIPEGYHSGSGSVWAQSLEESTPGTASANKLLEGETAWVNGEEIIGTVPINEPESIILDPGSHTVIPEGYHDGTGIISTKSLEELTPADADPSEILRPATAWVNGQKIEGTLELDGTATAADVISGKTFYNFDAKRKLEGSLFFDGNASEDDVLKGSTFYSNDHRRKKTGTLELSGTATPLEVLEGYTFYNNNPKNKREGSIPVIEPKRIELDPDETYTIPKGYHNGTGTVSTAGFGPLTPGTAEPGDILYPETAWVNGEQITGILRLTGDATPDKVLKGYEFYSNNAKQKLSGSIEILGGVSKELDPGEVYTFTTGYYNTNSIISSKPLSDITPGTASSETMIYPSTAWVNGKLVTGSIVPSDPIKILDLVAGRTISIPKGYYIESGFISTASLESQTQATAMPSQILSGETAWVNGEYINGSMPNNYDWHIENVSSGTTVNIPKGYHDGSGYISTIPLSEETKATATSEDILSPKTAWVDGVKIQGKIPTWITEKIRISTGHDIIIPAGYYSNPIHIYALFIDEILDLTGTSAYYDPEYYALCPNGTGYIDKDILIITEIPV